MAQYYPPTTVKNTNQFTWRSIKLFIAIVMFFSFSTSAFAQCVSTGSYYPGAVQTYSSGTAYQQVSTCIFGGDYSLFNVTKGNTYEWSYCSADGGNQAGIDNQLTLFHDAYYGPSMAYSDDACGSAAKIVWTAGYTGTARVKTNQWNCITNATCQTLVWKEYCTSIGCVNLASESTPSLSPPSLCSNGTVRVGSGAYYDLPVQANTYYNFTWNNNGASNINGFCGVVLNGSGSTGNFSSNTTNWFSGTTTLVRISAYRSSCNWVATSGIMTYRYSQPTLGTVSTAGPVNFCASNGNFGTAVTVSGYTLGSPVWDWGSNNGTWNNNWVTGASSSTATFPKKVGTSNGDADRIRVRIVNYDCSTTSSTILIQNRWNENPGSVAVSPTAICSNALPGTIALTATFPTATNMNGTVEFATTCGGTPVATISGNGTTTVTANITPPGASTTYYARYNPGTGTGCSPGSCVSAAITYNTAPTASAGGAISTCTGNATITMTGATASGTYSGTATWSGGTGTWAQNADPALATFTPTATSGSFTATLTLTGTGGCANVTSTRTIAWGVGPVATAGAAINSCTGTGAITMTGATATGTYSGNPTWSGGTGTWVQNANPALATFTPTANNGSFTATLTLTGTNGCSNSTSTRIISWGLQPVATAGATINSCTGTGAITMTGSTATGTFSGTPVWSGGTGTWVQNANPALATFTPTASNGTFTATLTLTGINGCTNSTSTRVINWATAPVATAGAAINTCTGNAAITMTGSTATGTFSGTPTWTGGTGTWVQNANPALATFTPTATSGTFTATLTLVGINGCTNSTSTRVISWGVQPVVNAGADLALCTGVTAKAMTGATATGTFSGTPVWTGAGGTWAQNANPALATFTPAASNGTVTATLTLTGINGCTTVTDTRVVSWATQPVVTPGATINSCTGTGAIAMTGTTTTGNFSGTPTWTGGTGTWVQNANPALATFTPTASNGTFTATLTLTGYNGCTNGTGTRVINWATAPVATAGAAINTCTGNAAITMTSATATGTYSGTPTWTGGTGTWVQNANPALATFTPTATSGSFTATLTLVGINGCTNSTSTRVISWGVQPVVNAGADLALCTGVTAKAMTGATATGTFSGTPVWTGAGGTWAQNANPALATFTPAASNGTVTATLTLTGINGCTTVTDTRVVAWATQPVATPGSAINTCTGAAAITMTGSSTTGNFSGTPTWTGGTGTWVQNANPALATFTPSASNGTFTATLTLVGYNGCTNGTATRVISWGVQPVATAGAAINTCTGNTAITMTSATATGTYSGTPTWTGGTGTWVQNANPALATFTPTATSGSFTATLTLVGINGCTNSTSTRVISWGVQPVVNAGADLALCTGVTAKAMTGATATGTFSGTPIWSGAGGTWAQNANPALATFTPAASNGTVTATLTLTGINGCTTVTDTRVVAWATQPVATPGAAINTCTGAAAITMTGSSTTGNFSGTPTWTGGTGTWVQNANPALATFTPAASNGSFTATLTLTGYNGCTNGTATRVISWGVQPVATAGSAIVTCTGMTAIPMTGATATGTYSGTPTWTVAGGTWVQNADPALATFTPTTASGSITATLTLVGINGCVNSTSTRTITWGTQPVVNAGADLNLCTGLTAKTMTGATATGTFSGNPIWTGTGGTWVQNLNPALATFTPAASNGTVTATLTLTGINGCTTVTDTRVIAWATQPVATPGAAINTCTGAAAISMTGSSTTGNFSGTPTWTGGTGTWVQNANPALATFTPAASNGSFTATLTLTGYNGCTNGTATRVISWGVQPVATAGSTINSCTGTSAIPMTGATATGTYSGTPTWTVAGGTWIQNADPALATFTPSTASGSVTATLTLVGINGCVNSTSTRTIAWGTQPVVNAGADLALCTGVTAKAMTGATATGTFSGTPIWTGAGGTWVQNANPALATFTPAASNGTVTATLTLTGINGCTTVTDTRVVSWATQPVVTPGAAINTCTGAAAITMTGSSTTGNYSGTPTWTGGVGTWVQNANPALATFTPSASNGTFTATLTLTGYNGCSNGTGTRVISWGVQPVATAGGAIVSCTGMTAISMTGATATGTYSGTPTWTVAGGTWVQNANPALATFTPTTASGSVTATLTLVGINGCVNSTSTRTITWGTQPVAAGGATINTCTGAAVITMTGATATGTFSGTPTWTGTGGTWVQNANPALATFTPSTTSGTTTATLTLTGTNGCSNGTATRVINWGTAPTTGAGSAITICSGTSAITMTGATASGTFSAATWTGGTGTWVQNINPALATFTPSAASGTFTATLTITGANGCGNVTGTRVITWGTQPVATPGSAIASCTGAAALTMTGASATGTFTGTPTWTGAGGTWVQNANPALATFTPSTTSGTTTATLTLTGTNGCTNGTATRTIAWGVAPVATAGGAITTCTGTTAITMTGATATGTHNGSPVWSGGTGTWAQNANPALATFTPSASNGTFTATLTLTGINGCSNSTSTRTITWGTATATDAGPNIASCTGTTAIAMTGATATGTFSAATWTGTGGTWIQNINPALATFTPGTTSGTTTATLTITGSNGCGNVNDTRTIAWGVQPVATAGSAINTCTGNTVITMTGAIATGTYSGTPTWTGTGGTWVQNTNPALATFTPSTTSGSITATLTLVGINGCINSTDTRTIAWGVQPVAIAGGTITTCTGTAAITMAGATATGTFSGTPTWTGGTGTWVQNANPALATFTPSAGSGSFTATLTLVGINGCSNSTSTRTITWGTATATDAGPTITTCTGTSVITMTGATATGTFSAATWTGTGGTWVQDINPALATFTPGAASGSITATLTLTGTNGCGNITDTRTITWGTQPTVNAGTDFNTCTGTSVIQMTGSTATGTFSAATWTGTGGTWVQNIVPDQATFTPGSASGTLTATLTITGSNGCSNVTDTRTISWGTQPVATAGTSINSCAGNAVITMTGATATGTYSGTPTWTGGTGTGAWAQDANPALATFTPSTASGTFTATLTLTGTNGCTNSTSTRTITWNSSITGLTANAGPNPVCEGTDFVLTSGVSTGVVTSWVWSGPNAYNSTAQSHFVYGADESVHEGIYTVAASNSCGTVTASTASVNVHRNIIGLNVNATPSSICVGSDLQLTASYVGLPIPTGDVTWQWSNSNASFTSTEQNPVNANIQLNGAGIYEVSASNVCGVQVANGPIVQVDTQIVADADVALLAQPGPDANVIEACGTLVVNLQGNNAGSASAQWSLVPNVLPNSGTVVSYSPDDQSNNVSITYSQVDPLPVVFRWTITNGVCPPSESDVRVIFDPAITATAVLAGCSFTSADSIMVQVSGAGGSGTLNYGAPTEGELRVDINANNKAFTVPMDGASHSFTVSDAFCSITESVSAPNGHPVDVAHSASNGTTTAICNQADFNKWTTYSDNTNNAILAINDNGQDLGTVNVTVYKDAAVHNIQQSLSADNCQGYDGTAMQRHYMIAASNAFSNPVDVRLYFTEAELQALITASQNNDIMGDLCSQNDNIYDMNGLYVTKYTGVNEDGDYTNNSPSGLYKVYGDATALPTQPDGPLAKSSGGFGSMYSGGQAHNYVQLSVSEFSELWLHGSQNGTALPVEMLYIEANAVDNSYIQVKWATIIEINNNGFQVERSTDGANWTAIGWVDGNNNATVQHNYSYDDNTVAAGVRYYYRLKQIDNDGEYEYTGIVSAIINSQITFAVKDFVPNPAISTTNLIISSINEQEINVEMYNIIGERMISETHQLNKGNNMISFDLDNLAAGTYTAVVSSANEVYSKKLVVTK